MSTPPEGPRSDDPWTGPPAAAHGSPPYGAPPGQYGQPPHGQPPYGAPYGVRPPAPRNGMGTAALVLGIVGLLLSILVIGALPGILAVVFGAVGLARVRRREATNRGAALTGIITGILAVAVAVALVAVGLSVFQTQFGELRNCLNNAQTPEQQQACRDRIQRDLENRVNR